ncbi:MAG TPA: T9SS type A sorting domain-containing protein [Rubricoccaceae bacterium]|jgi:hypothetical protein
MRLVLAAVCLALASPALGQQRIYVDGDAAGDNTGTSWGNAYTDLQAALAFASGHAGAEEVWVAEGTYRPTATAAREVSFRLFAGVALYGGFDGTETGRDQRDWVAHRTTLSGDIGAPGVRTDNTVHVVLATGSGGGVTATTVLDGFTVTEGYASGTGPAVSPGDGAGLYVSGASPTLRHLVVTGNEATPSYGAGGGVYVSSATPGPLLEDVTFVGNAAGSRGGGLSASFAAPRLVGCRFESNRARTGGGAHLSEAAAVLREVLFESNEATLTDGGGLYVDAGDVVASGLTFVRNRAALSGGGAYFTASGGHPFHLGNAAFYGNVAGAPGGGLALNGPEVTVANVVFVGNRATRGGAVDGSRNAPLLVGVTATANVAPSGAGLFMSGGRVGNAVFWGNEGPEIGGYAGEPPADVQHAVVEGGFPGGTAIVDADPLFVRRPVAGADGTWGTADDDYGDLRFETGSPAQDAGLVALLPADVWDLDSDGGTAEPVPVDLSGSPRVVGASVDLGAYEGAVPTGMAGPPDGPARLAVAVRPNPATGAHVEVAVLLGEAGPVRVVVLDAIGREVAVVLDDAIAAGERVLSVKTSRWPAGVYVVHVTAGTGATTSRLVVVR